MAGLSATGEIRPEDGDLVDWGQNAGNRHFGLGEETEDPNAANQKKRRNQDLFVI
jgi:hypothetical protein